MEKGQLSTAKQLSGQLYQWELSALMMEGSSSRKERWSAKHCTKPQQRGKNWKKCCPWMQEEQPVWCPVQHPLEQTPLQALFPCLDPMWHPL